MLYGPWYRISNAGRTYFIPRILESALHFEFGVWGVLDNLADDTREIGDRSEQHDAAPTAIERAWLKFRNPEIEVLCDALDFVEAAEQLCRDGSVRFEGCSVRVRGLRDSMS